MIKLKIYILTTFIFLYGVLANAKSENDNSFSGIPAGIGQMVDQIKSFLNEDNNQPMKSKPFGNPFSNKTKLTNNSDSIGQIKQKCSMFFKNEIPNGNELLKNRPSLCDDMKIQNIFGGYNKYGVSISEFKTCLLKADIIKNKFSDYVESCSDVDENEIISNSKYLNCFNYFDTLLGSKESFKFCIKRYNIQNYESSNFTACIENSKDYSNDIKGVINKCEDWNYRDAVSGKEFKTCMFKLEYLKKYPKVSFDVCTNQNIKEQILDDSFNSCKSVAEEFLKNPLDVIAICSNDTLKFQINKKEYKDCLVNSIASTSGNYFYFSLFNQDMKKQFIEYLADDCEKKQPDKTNIQNNSFQVIHLIKNINVHSFDSFYSNAEKIFWNQGGFSGLSFDSKSNELYVISDKNAVNGSSNVSQIYNFKLSKNFELSSNKVIPLIDSKNVLIDMDTEGIVKLKNGHFIISSEYSGYNFTGSDQKIYNLNQFDSNGQWVTGFDLPSDFKSLSDQDTNRNKRDRNNNSYFGSGNGLAFNKGLEALTATLDEKYIFTANEEPLLQDQETKKDCNQKTSGFNTFFSASGNLKNRKNNSNNFNEKNNNYSMDGNNYSGFYNDHNSYKKQCGGSVRILKFANQGASEKNSKLKLNILNQYKYDLDSVSGNGLSEMLAINDNYLFTLERAYDEEEKKLVVKLYLVKLSDKSIIVEGDILNKTNSILPVSKILIQDFSELIPELPAGFKILDNYEALSFGPVLPNGHRTLIVASDNNFSSKQRSSFLIFEINESILKTLVSEP